jgi:hypothetical protein
MSHFDNCILTYYRKKSVNSDDQQFHQYQHSK